MIKPEVKLLVENWKTFIKSDIKTLNEAVKIGDFNFDDQAAALINQEIGNIQNLTVDIVNHAGGNVSERDGMLFYNGLKFEPSEFIKLLKNTNFDKLIAQKKSNSSTQTTNQQQATPQQQTINIKQKLTNALLEKNPNGIGKKNENLIKAFESMVNNYLNGIWGLGGIKVASHTNDRQLYAITQKPEVASIINDSQKTAIGNTLSSRTDPKAFEQAANKAYDLYVLISKGLSILKKEYEAAGQVQFYSKKMGDAAQALNTFYTEQQKILK